MTSRRQILRSLVASPLGMAALAQSSRASEASEDSGELTKASTTESIRVEAKLGDLMQSIPTEQSERLKLVKSASETSCEGRKEALEAFDIDEIKDEATISKNALGLSKNILSHTEEVFSTSLPLKYIDEISNVARFVPFLSALQNYVEVCCEVQALEDEAEIADELEDFYLALFLLVAELVLLPSSVGFRSAFVGTRYVANVGLVRIRDVVGLRAYSVLLSGVHWGFRGTVEGTISYIIQKTAETIAAVDFEEITELEESDLSYDFLDETEEENDGLFSFFDDEENERDQMLSELRESENSTPTAAPESDESDEDDGTDWWPPW